MDISISNIKAQGIGVAGFGWLHDRLREYWNRLPAWACASYWPAIAAAVAIFGLLAAFQQVVHGAVRQGDLRRQTSAIHAEATWRCHTLRGIGASDDCLLRLQEITPIESTLQVRVSAATR